MRCGGSVPCARTDIWNRSGVLQLQDHLQSWVVVSEADERVMQLGDRRNESQAEAASRCIAATLQPIEAIEDLFSFLLLDASPVVWAVLAKLERDRHRGSLWSRRNPFSMRLTNNWVRSSRSSTTWMPGTIFAANRFPRSSATAI